MIACVGELFHHTRYADYARKAAIIMRSTILGRQAVQRFARLVGVLVFLAATGYTSHQPAHAQGTDYQQIITDSKAEKDDLLIHSNLPKKNWEPLITAFNKKYPWVKVVNSESTAFGVFESYYTEIDASQPSADILVSTDIAQWEAFILAGDNAYYLTIESKNLPDYTKADEYFLYQLASDPMLIIWNKKLVKTPITSLEALAKLIESDPKGYANQVSTLDASRSVNGLTAYWFYIAGKGDAGWKLLERLGSASVKPETNAEKIVEDVLRGKSKIGVFVESTAVAPFIIAKNPDLGWSPVLDGMPILNYLMAITQTSNSPNSARLFLDFALSKEGQIAVTKGNLPAYREDLSGKVPLHDDDLFGDIDEANQLYVDTTKAPKTDAVQEEFIARWKTTFQIK